MKKALRRVLGVGFILFAFLCFFSAKWYVDVYGDVGFDAVAFTLLTGFGGVESNLIWQYILKGALPAVVLGGAVAALILALPNAIIKFKKLKLSISSLKIKKLMQIFVSVSLSIALVLTAVHSVKLTGYVTGLIRKTDIYEEYYVDPQNTEIKFPKNQQNLIFIFLESMEMTVASSEYGGAMEKNLIPELCNLAEQNINFSNTDTVGGGVAASGCTWTIGAMVSQTCGIPLKLSIGKNFDFGRVGKVALSGATTLSDILNDNGYYQALLVGSDAAYGGRKLFYEAHKTDKIYDVFTAEKDGIIPEGYRAWWGMEDLYLYSYAKKILTEVASSDKPFALTMLTVDTHHIGGYKCSNCKNEETENYSNVYSCASRQLYEFINWVKSQSFYENTTIVISGDHPSMDAQYIYSFTDKNYTRRLYNCFINSKSEAVNAKNREFCTMDMFPTVLSALGCEIEGERLGLGTNLFSKEPTLVEQIGYEKLNRELNKFSNYYEDKILNDKGV